MACHELAALRLGLMNTVGIDDPNEREHEVNELGDQLEAPGPLRQLASASSLNELLASYQSSLRQLQRKISQLPADDRKQSYYRSLLILTKKVEFELSSQIENLERLFQDLDEIHHFVHEIYPD